MAGEHARVVVLVDQGLQPGLGGGPVTAPQRQQAAVHVQVVGVRREAVFVGERQPVAQHLVQLREAQVPVEHLAEVGVAAGDRLVRAVPCRELDAGPQQPDPVIDVDVGLGQALVVQAQRDEVEPPRPVGEHVRLPQGRTRARMPAQREQRAAVDGGSGDGAPARLAGSRGIRGCAELA